VIWGDCAPGVKPLLNWCSGACGRSLAGLSGPLQMGNDFPVL